MKKLPLLVFICIASICDAQKVNIFRDGSIEQHQVEWAAESGIRVERNRFIRHEKIDSIQIIENGKLSGQLSRFYIITKNSANYRPPSPIIAQANDTDFQQPITTVNESGHPGAAIEMLGAMALTAYFVMSNSYVNEIKSGNLKANAPSPLIPILGSGFMAVGFVIDLSDGSKKKKH